MALLELRTRTDRMMARTAVAILCFGLCFCVYMFAGPLWWGIYATFIDPFTSSVDGLDLVISDDPFVAAAQEQLHHQSMPAAQQKQQPVVKPPFDINNFPLSRERVHSHVQDGFITVTWANHHYLDFAKTWTFHVKRIGITGYMVGAMDDEMLRSLADLDINTWRMDSGITKNDLGWGSENFHKMGRVKIALIKQFLDLDVNVIISDIDTAWLQNPLPYFNRYPEADVLTSTDQLSETVTDDSLELFPQAGASFNIGIMMFRVSSKAFVEDWIKKLEDPKMWDQTAFNDLARLGHTNSDRGNKNLWKGDQGKLTMGVLPASIFASGHMFFVQRKYEELGLKPYVAHATFQYSGTPGKRNRFREFMLFDDPPEYYDHDKGFIYINIDIPKELLGKAVGVKGAMTGDKLDNHYNLVHYQLLRLRTGLALATASGRVMILPPIWCELDKYWAPLYDGGIPGTKWKRPFICPMDHVLDIEAYWHKPLPENEFGPHIEWREYSFLQNPRMSAAVNQSRLVIEAGCQGDCPGGAGAIQGKKLPVNSQVTIARIKEVLATPAAAAFKIVEVPSAALEAMHQLWTTFEGQDKDRFVRRLQHYVSVVCCMEKQPGWVWYDFFTDVLPRTDRFGRTFQKRFVYYGGETKELVPGSPKDE